MDFFTKLTIVFLAWFVVFCYAALFSRSFYDEPQSKQHSFFVKMIFVCLFAAAMTFLFGVN